MSFSFITIYSEKVPQQNTRITDVSKLTKTTGTSIEAPATIDELRTLAYVIQKNHSQLLVADLVKKDKSHTQEPREDWSYKRETRATSRNAD